MNTQDKNQLLDQFSTVIRELISIVEVITAVENEKAQLASLGHHKLIDSCIQKEQAHILKLRGLEQRRIRLAEQLGWNGLTFRQILEQGGEDENKVLLPLFTQLEERIEQLLSARDSSERIIQSRLQELEILLFRQTGKFYDSSGKDTLGTPIHLHDQFV